MDGDVCNSCRINCTVPQSNGSCKLAHLAVEWRTDMVLITRHSRNELFGGRSTAELSQTRDPYQQYASVPASNMPPELGRLSLNSVSQTSRRGLSGVFLTSLSKREGSKDVRKNDFTTSRQVISNNSKRKKKKKIMFHLIDCHPIDIVNYFRLILFYLLTISVSECYHS